MRAYRLRRDGPPRRRLPLPAKAHQARDAADSDEGGDIGSAMVQPISLAEARDVILRHGGKGVLLAPMCRAGPEALGEGMNPSAAGQQRANVEAFRLRLARLLFAGVFVG
jgi:hypothetical protein